MNPVQPAYVIHTRSYRETSGLIDIITQDMGRISLVARGYKTSRKGLLVALQPFRKLEVSWSGKGDLKTLVSAEEISRPVFLQGSALTGGLYINELLLRLLHPYDPCPGLFESYESTLDNLRNGGREEATLRVYEKNLLEELGYGLELGVTIGGDTIEEGQMYYYRPREGLVPVTQSLDNGVMISGRSLLCLQHEQLEEPQVLKETKRLMRLLIEQHLDGRPLRTRDLYRFL